MLVKIFITPKKLILDPQGKATEIALANLGFTEVSEVRIGKYIELKINQADQSRIKDMCEKLLANTVMEDYSFEIIS